MKKTILIFTIFFISLAGFCQKKEDTTIVVTLPLAAYQQLISAIDQNIDSKKASKEIIDFIIKNAAIKPKETK